MLETLTWTKARSKVTQPMADGAELWDLYVKETAFCSCLDRFFVAFLLLPFCFLNQKLFIEVLQDIAKVQRCLVTKEK